MAIAQMYYNENNYGVALTGASQSTSIEIEGCAKAYSVLITNVDLRRTFGENGRMRARDVFDWRHIIRTYDELWESLSEQRRINPLTKSLPDNWQAVHPGYPNPWQMFKSFPTAHLAPTDILRMAMDSKEVDILMNHGMNLFVPQLLLSQDQLIELIAVIRRAGTVRIQDVLAAFPQDSHDLLWRCFGWILKCGICTLERPST
jgi:hypothetical protein